MSEISLDNALQARLKALNCKFSIAHDVLTVERGFSLKGGGRVMERAFVKKLDKLVRGFYPKAVSLPNYANNSVVFSLN